MIVYFDTSAILPVVIEEPTSQVASRLWDEADRVVSSRLVYPEGRAALAMAIRMNRVDELELQAATEDFEVLCAQLDIVEVTEELVRSAGAMAEQFGLRGYDAVHLASLQAVGDSELVLAARDQNLVAAAQALGITTASPHDAGLANCAGSSGPGSGTGVHHPDRSRSRCLCPKPRNVPA